jgi:hypothetical protein
VPVALCGVPSTEAAAAVAVPVAPPDAVLDAVLDAVFDPVAGALELPELLELQPAAVSARTATAAAPIGLRCFMLMLSLLVVGSCRLLAQAAVSPR